MNYEVCFDHVPYELLGHISITNHVEHWWLMKMDPAG